MPGRRLLDEDSLVDHGFGSHDTQRRRRREVRKCPVANHGKRPANNLKRKQKRKKLRLP